MKLLKDINTISIVVGVVVAIVIAAFQGAVPEKLLPLAATAVLALLFLSLLLNAEQRFERQLDQRLPAISFLHTRAEVEASSLHLVNEASDFIVATGGRSRAISYLRQIEQRVRLNQTLYWRIISEPTITHELADHLRQLVSLSHVVVMHFEDTELGNILITDGGFILALPVPGHGELKGVSVPNPSYARTIYSNYMTRLVGNGRRLTSEADISSLVQASALASETRPNPTLHPTAGRSHV